MRRLCCRHGWGTRSVVEMKEKAWGVGILVPTHADDDGGWPTSRYHPPPLTRVPQHLGSFEMWVCRMPDIDRNPCAAAIRLANVHGDSISTVPSCPVAQ